MLYAVSGRWYRLSAFLLEELTDKLSPVTTQIVVVHWMTRTPLDLASKIRIEEPRRPVFDERKTSNESSSLPPAYNPTDPLADSRVP